MNHTSYRLMMRLIVPVIALGALALTGQPIHCTAHLRLPMVRTARPLRALRHRRPVARRPQMKMRRSASGWPFTCAGRSRFRLRRACLRSAWRCKTVARPQRRPRGSGTGAQPRKRRSAAIRASLLTGSRPSSAFDPARGVAQRIEVHAGLEAEAVEQVHQILAGEVAAGTLRVGVSAPAPTEESTTRTPASRQAYTLANAWP